MSKLLKKKRLSNELLFRNHGPDSFYMICEGWDGDDWIDIKKSLEKF